VTLIPFAIIFLIFAAAFGWCGLRGIQTGMVYIPIVLFREAEYERDGEGFRFALFLNFFGALASVAIAIAIWSAA